MLWAESALGALTSTPDRDNARVGKVVSECTGSFLSAAAFWRTTFLRGGVFFMRKQGREERQRCPFS